MHTIVGVHTLAKKKYLFIPEYIMKTKTYDGEYLIYTSDLRSICTYNPWKILCMYTFLMENNTIIQSSLQLIDELVHVHDLAGRILQYVVADDHHLCLVFRSP